MVVLCVAFRDCQNKQRRIIYKKNCEKTNDDEIITNIYLIDSK